jgi:tol-pal system protein YbgF
VRALSLALLLLPGLLLLMGGPARAQDNGDLIQRVQRLEADIQILQRQVNLGAGAPRGDQGGAVMATPLAPGAAASLDTRVSQLEEQMQSLTGHVEEVGHNIAQLQDRLDRLSKDMDARLTRLEQGQGAAASVPAQQPAQPQAGATDTGAGESDAGEPASQPAQQPLLLIPPQQAQPQQQAAAPVLVPPAASGNGAPNKPVAHVVGNGQVLPLGSPQQQYDYARALLVQQDYGTAETAFKAFVNTHPDDQLAGPAQYWLGETYYMRGNFQDAAQAFASGFEKFPRGGKAPDSLLKLGMSLAKLNRKKDACSVFASFSAKFPAAPVTLRQSAQRERHEAGCG